MKSFKFATLLGLLLLGTSNHLAAAEADSSGNNSRNNVDEKFDNDNKALTQMPKTELLPAIDALLPAPTAVIPTSGDRQVLINWQRVNGAKSYNIYWSNNTGVSKSSSSTYNKKINVATPPFVHGELTNGSSYSYIITAINAKGESAASREITAIPEEAVPARPSGVAAVQGNGEIKILWNSMPTATSYNIYWSLQKNISKSTASKIVNVKSPYIHAKLTNETSYYYVVTAVNSGGESVLSAVTFAVPQVAVPAAPPKFAVVAGSGEVKVSWEEIGGATSYNIYWDVKPGVTQETGKKIENVKTGNRLSELTNGKRYYYIVTALNSAGESGSSKEVSTVPQVSAPAAPSRVRAIPEDGKVTITWQAVEGASSYNLYWSKKLGVTISSGKIIQNINTNEFTQSNLENGSPYFYALTAVNAGGESALSAEVITVPQKAAPQVPANIGVIPGNGTTIIDWQLVSNATSYNLYWSSKSGVTKFNGKKIENVMPNLPLSNLLNGTRYFYVVTALNAGGESADSIEVSAIPQVPAPAVPIGVTVIPANEKVSIAWDKVAGATYYNIYWSTKPGVTKNTASKIEKSKISGAHTGLKNGSQYYYAVTSANAGGESALSNEVVAIPQVSAPAAPVDITATIGDKKVTLNWSNFGYARATTSNSYNIYWNQKGNVTADDTVINSVTPPYTHTGLNNGEAYYYVIAAYNDGGETASKSIKVTLLPDVPVFISSKGGDQQIILNWDKVKHAESYSLYWDSKAGVNSSSNKLENVMPPYAHDKLTNGLTYHYVVTANNQGGESTSNETLVTLAPDAPSISKLQGGFELINVDVKETTGATSYHLYWNTTGNVTKKDQKIKNISVNYKHLKLNNGVTYYYKLSAENAGGESDLSVEANITLAPDAPSITEAKVINETIELSWKEMPGADAYNIYWNTNGNMTDKDNKITNTDSAVDKNTNEVKANVKSIQVKTPYTHSGLTKGTTYYYVVTALNKGGESKVSSIFKATLAPDVPKMLSLKGETNQVTISWTAMHGATAYNIYWDNKPDVTLKSKKLENVYSANIKGVSPTFIHSQVPNGVKYHYRVTATNAGGESDASTEDSVVLPPDAPVIISATGAHKIATLIWNPVKHADSFTVYWGINKGINKTDKKIINATSPYTFYELENRRPYYYVISAHNAGGESLMSSEVTVTPHNKPLSSLFNDSKLQQCINELAKSSNWLYADQIVGTVYCGGAGIKDLTGIEYLINITKLSLKNNSISQLEPLSSLTKLTSLSLDSNNVSDVKPLAVLSKLTTLHLHNNSITDISALSGLAKLYYLSLYKNSITDVSALNGLTQLTSLYLNSNKIRDVDPLGKLVNLKFLDLGRNNIGGKGVGHLDSLASLVNADNIHLIRNSDVSCKELTMIITTMGSPPVDTDGINSNFDVAAEGTNCTEP